MINRTLALFLVLISAAYSFNYSAFEAYLHKASSDWQPAGVAVAIVEDGKITYMNAFGWRSSLTQKPLTEETVFPIASLSKAFSALLMLKMEEDGKLSINDPVIKYLPDFKLASDEATKGMTIAKLFQHRSGLRGFAYDTLVETGWSEQEIFAVLNQVYPTHPFDEQFDYQNIFPGLFGWIAEKITGDSLNTLFKREIFEPLGMNSASLGEFGVTQSDGWFKRLGARLKSMVGNQSDQHYTNDKGYAEVIKNGNPAIYRFPTSRGINANIKDMAKWLQFWLNEGVTPHGKRLVSPERLSKMLQKLSHVGAPQGGRLFPKERVTDIYYGMGWYIHNYATLERVISHMGGMTGTRSIITYVPGKKIGMVLLSNLGGMRVNLMPEAIRSKFLDLVAGIDDNREWSAELKADLYGSLEKIKEARTTYRIKNPVAARPLQDYVGIYENKLYGQLEVALENAKLILKYRDLKSILTHWNGDNFSFKANEFTRSYSATDYADITFGGDANQPDVCAISLLYEGINPLFKRKK
ncbi:MAG: serine hydrolase [Candidatus Paracaedibacteraceae bacterium]|nr:serine hydrolase [Candidatus Paracaedibacteraceae bacterium]